MIPLSTECFQRAEALEFLSEQIYHRLAQRFVQAPRATAMFQRLAQEETQHANRVRLLNDRYQRAPEVFSQVAEYPLQLDALIQEGHVLLGMVENQTSALSLTEALRLMIEMERKFFVVHSEVVISDQFPEIKVFFKHLARGDQEHSALLTSIAAPE